MSKEEAMNALIESSMELRRDDIELGKRLERDRIVNLYKPLAKCDPELCGPDGKAHYGLDCDAYTFQFAIQLIEENMEKPIQEKMNERAGNADSVSDNDTKLAVSARTHEETVETMVDLFTRLSEVVDDYLHYTQIDLNLAVKLYENSFGSDSELRIAQLRQAREVWNLMLSLRDDFEDAYFQKLDIVNAAHEREKYENEKLH